VLLRHLEAPLGPLVESASVSEKNVAVEGLGDLAILAFGDRAALGFATFGVSRHVLHARDDAATEELVLTVSEGWGALRDLLAAADTADLRRASVA
jgi:hypothetical protein